MLVLYGIKKIIFLGNETVLLTIALSCIQC